MSDKLRMPRVKSAPVSSDSAATRPEFIERTELIRLLVKLHCGNAMRLLGSVTSTNLSSIYIAISLPAMLFLCLVIAPFGSNDERQHFLRIVSIVDGHIVPEVSIERSSVRLDKRVAGGWVENQVVDIANKFGHSGIGSGSKLSIEQLKKGIVPYIPGNLIFSEHSNTALYPPFLYTAPITAILFLKSVKAPVLVWLYLGRVANSLAASALIWYAIKRGGGISHSIIIIAILPVFLFQCATLSADALLLPLFVVFSALLARLASNHRLSKADYCILCITVIMISAGKVAYLPVAILPAAVVWINTRCFSRKLALFIALFILTAVVWSAWAYVVHDKVFSMRPDVVVDPAAQIHFMLSHPYVAIRTLFVTIAKRGPSFSIDVVGRRLGYSTVNYSTSFCIALICAVIGMSLVRTREFKYKRNILALVVTIVFICFIAIFELIDIQYNEVGASFISGVQGRYFAPLLVLVCVFLPVTIRPIPQMHRLYWIPVVIASFSTIVTADVVFSRYWL